MTTIPKGAKKVFKGIIYDVYHWKQKQFDGSYKTFEMLERTPVVDIIATVGDKIILEKQMQPGRACYYSLPGGHIDPGEKALPAARRELLEETGHKEKEMILYYVDKGYSKLRFIQHIYIARDCKKIAKQSLDPGEKNNAYPYQF